MTVVALLSQAEAEHRAGRLGQADALYRQVLAANPKHSGAFAQLGLLTLQAGHPGAALSLLDQALALRPNEPETLSYQGLALKALGRFDAAIASFQAALRRKPGAFDLLYNLGNAQREAGQLEAAATTLRRAIKRQPDFVDAHNNLGNTLRQLGRFDEAAECFRRAIVLSPQAAPLHFNMGAALELAGQPAPAAESFRAACLLAPESAEPHHKLGQMLARLAQSEAALAAFAQALRLGLDTAAVHTDIAYSLAALDRRQEALPHLQAAVTAAPDDAQAHTRLGTLLRDLADDAGATAALTEALRLAPGDAGARYNLGLCHLIAGRLEQGWPLYEARLEAHTGAKSRFETPPWRGEPLPGQVLLLHAEQGLGDTLMFCRFVAMAAAASRARVVLEVQAPLLRLLSGLAGADVVLSAGDTLPTFDRHCPLPSLPAALAISTANLPSRPYLRADAARVAHWRNRLAATPGRKVGLVWAGNASYEHDALRSVPPEALAILQGVAGVSFVSLQKERGSLPDGSPLPPIDLNWTGELADIAETAALMQALDLVVSADTAMVHLAGALGRPVWLLNRADTEWRWQRAPIADSVWYPTLRQFRQARPREWTNVLTAVRIALEHETLSAAIVTERDDSLLSA